MSSFEKPLWSVRVAITQEDSYSIGRGAYLVPGSRRSVVSFGLEDDFGSIPTWTVELPAESAEEAELSVAQVIATIRQEHGTGGDLPRTLWVASLPEDDALRFLEQAKELVESEGYELAVLAAQVHLERQLRWLLARARSESPAWRRRLTTLGRNLGPLHGAQALAAVELLFGVDLTKHPEWANLRAHFARRNDIAHEGRTIRRADAIASIRSVEAIWVALVDAANEANQGDPSPAFDDPL